MTCVGKSSSGEIVFRFMTFTLVLSLGSAKALSDQAEEIKRALSEDKKIATAEAPWMSRSDLLEGDIILNSTMNPSRASVTKKIYLWNNGIVPYVFDSSLSTSNYSFGNHRHFACQPSKNGVYIWNERFTIMFCYLHDEKIGFGPVKKGARTSHFCPW